MGELIEGEFQESTNSDSIVAYQYHDLQKAARAILAKATQTANQKIEQAKKNIAELEEKMRQQGYEKGYAEGLQKGEAAGRDSGTAAAKSEFSSQVDGVVGALQNMLGELNFRKQTIQAEAEADLLSLALDIARRIVRREIIIDERFVVPIVQEAIALTNNRNDLIVKLNPEDRDIVSDEIPALKAVFSDLGRVKLLEDETVERGGVKVLSREGEVDMSIPEQFSALERALIGDTEGMKEWDGSNRTDLPAADGQNNMVSPAAPPSLAQPVSEQPVQDNTPPKRPEKPRVQPEPRKASSAKSSARPAGQAQPAAKPAAKPAASAAQPEPVQSANTASVSSLAGITDLSAIALDPSVEAAISEVLSSQNNGGV